jgi:hypothetical protein
MGDPITAGIVGSTIMPSAGVALAAPTISGALATGLATGGGMGGGSLFGFEPTLGGIGQGITQAFKAPIFGQGGTLSNVGQAAGAYNQVNQLLGGQQQQMQMPGAMQIQRNQIAPMDYMSLLNPQQSTVLRPQPISLL